jgi:aryl-alcohol dehydrogenase-like predicted oxidoreductase
MIFKNKIGVGTSILGIRPELEIAHKNFVDYTITNGCRLYDTAESYSDGRAESIIGKCIADSNVSRNEFEIVSKFLPFKDPNISIQQSLNRLKTDYVDVYLLHFLRPGPRDANAMKPIIEKLVKVKQSGQTKHTGVCSISADELRTWRSAEEELGIPDELRINVCQFQYSLVKRQADIELQQLLVDLNFTSMPYSPFGGGRMSGSSRPPQPGFPGDFWANERTQKLAPIAESIGATVPQLILAFTNRFPNSVIFPKTFDKHRFDNNFKSIQFIPKITKSIYDQINALYPINFSVNDASADVIYAANEKIKQGLPAQ